MREHKLTKIYHLKLQTREVKRGQLTATTHFFPWIGNYGWFIGKPDVERWKIGLYFMPIESRETCQSIGKFAHDPTVQT